MPEEDVFHGAALSGSYPELDLMAPMSGMPDSAMMAAAAGPGGQSMQTEEPSVALQSLQYTAKLYTQAQQEATFRNNV